MRLACLIRIFLIRICSFFCFSNRSKVIFYHDIDSSNKYTGMSTPLNLFKQHINIIQINGYDIVSEITKKYGQIEICFDDGFLGLYDNIEFIKEQNIPIHLFVIPHCIGKKNYINKSQLLELNKLDLIKISSHTYTHRSLHKMNDNQIKHELESSKIFLENLLKTDINSVCYPKGEFNMLTIDIAEAIGYRNQYSSIPSFFTNRVVKNVIGRSLVQFAEKNEFKAILKGGDHILAFWYKTKHFKL